MKYRTRIESKLDRNLGIISHKCQRTLGILAGKLDRMDRKMKETESALKLLREDIQKVSSTLNQKALQEVRQSPKLLTCPFSISNTGDSGQRSQCRRDGHNKNCQYVHSKPKVILLPRDVNTMG